jgi:hypothetical protein
MIPEVLMHGTHSYRQTYERKKETWCPLFTTPSFVSERNYETALITELKALIIILVFQFTA